MTAPVTIEAKPDGKLLVTAITGPEDKGLVAVYWRRHNTEAHSETIVLGRKSDSVAEIRRAVTKMRRLRTILAPVYRLAEDTGVPMGTILAAIRCKAEGAYLEEEGIEP